MGALKDALDGLAEGSTTPAEVANLINKESETPGDLTFEEKEKRAMEDDYDYEDTFSEVVAAWISGKITDEQYNSIRSAMPQGDAGEEGEEEGAETPATKPVEPPADN